jgi:hypothetical protein
MRIFVYSAICIYGISHATADERASAEQRIADGEKRYADQDYRAAIESFNAVLGDSASTREQRARAYEYLGMSWLILGKKSRAREAFEDLLSIDAHYTLSDPSHSPKLREFFEEVRTRFLPGYGKAPDEAELEHSAPAGAVAGRPLELSAQATRNAKLVVAVVLHARRQGLLGYSAENMHRDASGRFTLAYTPPREASDYNLELFLEARDGKGRVVARVASPERPIVLPVKGAPLPPTPWFKRWYVWAAVGAVVGAAVIAGAVAGTAQRAPDGTLAPGRVSLGLRF